MVPAECGAMQRCGLRFGAAPWKDCRGWPFALPVNTVWLAIPRNLEKLRTETRLRLIRSYMPLGNSLADESAWRGGVRP